MKIEIIPVQNIELSIVNGNTRVIVPGTMDPRKLVVSSFEMLFCIPKILKNESNSQQGF